MKNHKIKKYLALATALNFFLSSQGVWASAKKKPKVLLSGNILSQSIIQPIQGSVPLKQISGTGTLNFAGEMFCGDGDVAHFKATRPKYQFYDTLATKSKLVLGYWVSKNTSIPELKNSQYFSLGTSDQLTTDRNGISKILASGSSSNDEAFNIIKNDVFANLKNIIKNSPKNDSTDKYSIRMAAMACPELKTTHGLNNGIKNLAVMEQFITGEIIPDAALSEVADKIKDGNSFKYYKIENDEGKIKVTFLQSSESGAYAIPQRSVYEKQVQNINKITSATVTSTVTSKAGITCSSCKQLKELDTYESLLSGLKKQIENIAESKSNCSTPGLSELNFETSDDKKQKLWEIFPVNASCLAKMNTPFSTNDDEKYFSLSKNDLTTCEDNQEFTTCSEVENIPSDKLNQLQTDLIDKKNDLIQKYLKSYLKPLLIKDIQSKLDSILRNPEGQIQINKTACFPIDIQNINSDPSQDQNQSEILVYNVASSMEIAFQSQEAGGYKLMLHSNRVPHPEGNYAIGGNRPYENTTSGNLKTIFNNTPGLVESKILSFLPFKIDNKESEKMILNDSPAANVFFNFRSVGCTNGPVYCKLNNENKNQF